MRSTGRLLTKVERALKGLVPQRGARILVGCSGGPDSTALLLALDELRVRRGLSLAAGHVDHGLQPAGEREAERATVQDLCRSIGVPLMELAVEPGLLQREARRSHRSLEETARVHRMECLRQAARQGGWGLIALGHTADDQAETMVMRFFQGSGARGLAGIQPRAGNVIRPLLACTRQDVLLYLSSRGRQYHTDASNDETRFLRNGIRAQLMPVVRRLFPGYRTALQSLSRKMSAAAAFVESELDRRDVWREDGPQGFSADADQLFALPPALRAESLYRVLDRASRARRRMPYRAVDSLLSRRPGRLDRGLALAGARITLHGGRFLVGPDIVCPGKRGYFSLVAEPGVSHAGSYRLSLPEGAEQAGRRSRTIGIEGTGVRPPVVVRSRRRGDRLRTAAGTKSLKKLLSQWGVPLDARDDAAVVADSRGVAAVIALPWGASAADREGCPGGGPVRLAPTEGKRS